MESKGTTLIERSSESSLTESWNVVDPHEVNNGSEGSDGESIEVIDEEAQNTESNPVKALDSNQERITPTKSKTVDDVLDQNDPSSEGSSDLGDYGDVEVIGSTQYTPLDRGVFWGKNIFIVGLFIASGLLSCAVFSLFLLKVEEFAMDQLKYFTSPHASENSGNDFQELLDQIKIYKEESSYLKGIVADLNTAVLTLKDELASRGDTSKSHIIPPVVPSAEDQLLNELLNVHTGNSPSGTESNYIPEEYEHSFNVIENMLRRLTLDEEREKNMETIKLFYLIPRHLTVLGAHYTTSQDIKHFIDTWKESLSSVNQHLIADMKEMQLKMIRHTVKHLKQTEKCFFKKLCDLKNLKKSECYDIFIKPYENDESFDVDWTICSTGQKQDVKSDIEGNQSCNSKTKNKSTKFNEGEINNCKGSVENKYTNNIKESDKGDGKKRRYVRTASKSNLKEPSKAKGQPSSADKGMGAVESKSEGGLGLEEEEGRINFYSSFSGSASCQWKKGRCGSPEGWWFLRHGRHRSRLRRADTRSDWLFDRAWWRRRLRFSPANTLQFLNPRQLFNL